MKVAFQKGFHRLRPEKYTTRRAPQVRQIRGERPLKPLQKLLEKRRDNKRRNIIQLTQTTRTRQSTCVSKRMATRHTDNTETDTPKYADEDNSDREQYIYRDEHGKKYNENTRDTEQTQTN